MSTSMEAVPMSGIRGGAISMHIQELAQELGGHGRAQLVWDCYSVGADPQLVYTDDELYRSIAPLLPSQRRNNKLGPEALEKLSQLYKNCGGQLEGGVAKVSHISGAADGTTKLLLQLDDDTEIETVIIPWKGQRSTLCISCQVGCRQACRFCATGRMGLIRQLSTDEILAQLFFAIQYCRKLDLPSIQNIVFMGMGESTDNYEAVRTACRILTRRELFQLSATKITVSTVAPTPESFHLFADTPCVLAWSVHAARDDLRKQLVPTTKYPMSELRQGLVDTLNQKPPNLRTTMLEVALMANVNDGMQEADELATFANGIVDRVEGCKLVVNLIPFNDIGHNLYQKPSPKRVRAFQERLWSHGVYAHVRATRGDDESAACGQLATKKKRGERA